LPATYEIWVDTHPTKQDSQHTSFKTSHRPAYTLARTRTLPDAGDYTQEVLLWNASGLITEGSVLTPYFYRGGKWVTPAVASEGHGGQRGTSRRWALERGLCVEGVVERRSVRVGERVWLSNGVRGFGWGKIMPARGGESSSENSV
jgi:branched-subunit amino acid aminotransferase/4-amino-4-deoxychorismate lyase